MKQVMLLRHAKSSWDQPQLKDYNRPLAKRGKSDAPRMGEFVRNAGYVPAAIISSPATRANQTAMLFAKSCGLEAEDISWNDDFYYGSGRDYLEAIQSLPQEFERILLVGHNPNIENVAGALCGGDQGAAIRMPTAALVCLESNAGSWRQVNVQTCRLKWMIIPKLLGNESN